MKLISQLFCCFSPAVSTKPIEVTVEEPKAQTMRVGSTVSFICTAKSKVIPARTCLFNNMYCFIYCMLLSTYVGVMTKIPDPEFATRRTTK